MKNDNYITIQGWMVNELHLSGNELILYALIYGFSQDGQSEYKASQAYMAESLGASRECVQRLLKKLEDNGLIRKIPSDNLFKTQLKYAAVTRCDEMSQHDVIKSHSRCDKKSHNNNSYNNNKEIEDKSSTKSAEIDAFVERIYKMYPSKCPKRNTSLGKCAKDKVRIKSLLKNYSMEEIERVVANEIATKLNVSFMSNFSTFLNNFPDPNCIENTSDNVSTAEVSLKDGAVNAKGEVWSEQLNRWLK